MKENFLSSADDVDKADNTDDNLDLLDISQSAGNFKQCSQSACSFRNQTETEVEKDKTGDTEKEVTDNTDIGPNVDDDTLTQNLIESGKTAIPSCFCETELHENSFDEKLRKLSEFERANCDNCEDVTCELKECCDIDVEANYRERLFKFCAYWPLVCSSHVIVNFNDLSWEKFGSGDFYFYVKQTHSKKVGLWVKFCVGSVNREIYVPESKFGKIFTMEWQEDIMSESSEILVDALKNCLAILEDSTEKLRWEEVVPVTGQFVHGNIRQKKTNQIQNTRVNGSYPENMKPGKNCPSNCVKCDKLSDLGNNECGSQGNGYGHNKGYNRNGSNSPGRFFTLNFKKNIFSLKVYNVKIYLFFLIFLKIFY